MTTRLEHWRVAPGVNTTRDGDSLILLSPDGQYYGLDGVGAKLWCGLEQGTLEDVIGGLCHTTRVPMDTVQRDALALFYDLERAGLIERE